MITLKKILVATDFSDASAAALLYGRNFARAHNATLHIVHVVSDLSGQPVPPGVVVNLDEVQRELEIEARQRLDALQNHNRTAPPERTDVMTSSSPARAILAYARDCDIDLIVIGTHGRTGLAHFFMGSVAQQVVRSAPCPVLTVRHPEREFARPDALQVVSRQQSITAN